MDDLTRRCHLAHYLAPFAVVVLRRDAPLDNATPDAALGLDNRVVDQFVTAHLRRLLETSPTLARRARRLQLPNGADAGGADLRSIESSLRGALRANPAIAETLWALLAPSLTGDAMPPGESAPHSPRGHSVRWLFGRHAVVGTLLTAVIAAVVVVGVWAEQFRMASLSPIELAVIWILSFLPGWLYLRFIGQRAGAIWDEFVLNLHRLRLDEPEHLPQPPVNSVFFRDWFDGGGSMLSRHRNIYRQKFDAYYGRCVSAASEDSPLKAGTFFPVVMATAIFAIGWTALFWDGTFLAGPPTTVLDLLAYGFLGAYLFDIQMLMRRFFQSDLKPSAYTSAALRVVIVMIIVLVMHQLPLVGGASRQAQAVMAFVIGLFPLVGMQALNRFVGKFLKSPVPSLQSAYPLSDLDGLNVWYEARLMEEGIEDMQNLVSANIVDVLLHTRVPVGRLIDWCDQAQLFVHLSPRPPGSDEARAKHARTALASFGVRSATTYLKAFANGALDDQGEAADPLVRRALERLEQQAPELSAPAVMTIARVLHGSPALRPIQSWRELEAAARPSIDNTSPVSATVVDFRPKPSDGGSDEEIA